MAICYLGIGSNLGNRRGNILQATRKIRVLKGTRVVKISGVIESEPVGGPAGQRKFLNAVLKIETEFSPVQLLKQLKQIERALGRVRTVRNGPRTIDLDILLYDNMLMHRKNLIIPHPRMFEREFVMKPLAELL